MIPKEINPMPKNIHILYLNDDVVFIISQIIEMKVAAKGEDLWLFYFMTLNNPRLIIFAKTIKTYEICLN